MSDTFGNYIISAEQTGPEQVPLMVTVPVAAILENSERLKVYRGHEERFPDLKQKNIPTNYDWEGIVTEMLFSYVKPKAIGLIVDAVTNAYVEGDMLSLECIASDPNWNHC
jgi:hypothetical protein